MDVALPVTSIRNAPLPQTYMAAKTALESCQAIDECKEWADKAAALASYARQAEDDELEKMAVRIRSRAMRRAGELLKQVSGRGNNQHTDATDSKLKQSDIARQAGMSERQQFTAVRIANIPAEDFERQVESSNPPTVTALAIQGTYGRKAPDPETWLQSRSPADFNLAMQVEGTIERYTKELSKFDLDRAVTCFDDEERRNIRRCIATLDALHDKIITRI